MPFWGLLLTCPCCCRKLLFTYGAPICLMYRILSYANNNFLPVLVVERHRLMVLINHLPLSSFLQFVCPHPLVSAFKLFKRLLQPWPTFSKVSNLLSSVFSYFIYLFIYFDFCSLGPRSRKSVTFLSSKCTSTDAWSRKCTSTFTILSSKCTSTNVLVQMY